MESSKLCPFCKETITTPYYCDYYNEPKCEISYCSQKCLFVDYSHVKTHILSIGKIKGNYIKNLSGIINKGNKCYMISSLQCLSICRLFAIYMISGEYKHDKISKDNLLCDELAKLYTLMYSEKSNENIVTLNISDFVKEIERYTKQYSNKGQEDSNLFITDFLTFLSFELNNRKITFFFIGEMIKITKCECGSTRSRPDEFKSLFISPNIKEGIICYSTEKKMIFQYGIFDENEELTIEEINFRMKKRFSKNISNLHYYQKREGFLHKITDKYLRVSQKDFLSSSKDPIVIYEYELKKNFIVVFVRIFDSGIKPIYQFPACFLMNKYYRVQTIFDELNSILHDLNIIEKLNLLVILNKTEWIDSKKNNFVFDYYTKTFEELLHPIENYCFIGLTISDKEVQKIKKLLFSINIPLENLLQSYFSPKKIKIYENSILTDKKCPKCNNLFMTKSIIKRLPYYLIITILVNKETRNDEFCLSMIQDKINVENYVDDTLIHQKDFSYTLIAINVHIGSNNSGHYKAQILNRNRWYLYSDGKCQEISEDERKQGVTYIYQRNPTPSKIIK